MRNMGSPQLAQSPAEGGGDQASAILFALRRFSMDFDVCLPATVISYDRDRNVAVIKPLIKVTMTDGTQNSRDEFEDIPVLSMGGGGFHINFPLKPGDLGWLYATDRDITLMLQAQASEPEQPAMTTRFHDYAAGSIFVPDVLSNFSAISGAENGMVIRSIDGKTQIAVFNDRIEIKTPTKYQVVAGESVELLTPLTHCSGDLVVDGNALIKKSLGVNGTSSMEGGVSMKGNASVGGTFMLAGLNMNAHRHPVIREGQPTGGPIN